MNRNNKEDQTWPNLKAKLDSDHAAKLAPYRFKVVLSFDEALPTSAAAARGDWVIWYLQSSYIGGTTSQLRDGLQAIATLDPDDSEKVSKITVLIKDHACFVSKSMSAEAYLKRQIKKSIWMGTATSIDKKEFATLHDLDEGSFDDIQELFSPTPGRMFLRFAWGHLV